MNVETAPMAGYTNLEFRRVLANLGAKVIWTEMVSAAALFYGVNNNVPKKQMARTMDIIKFEKTDGVKNVVQIFGKVPEHFEFAIEKGYLDGFDEININMGCPAKKIVRNGEGNALMGNINLAREIIETCVRVSKVPVTVKIRLGRVKPFDYIGFAKMCQDAGAKRIIVHGRYGEQMYSGTADWDAIGEIVRAVSVPVIANGDVRNVDEARKCLEVTGADGVMVGRALLPIYRKYFVENVRIIRGEKICADGGINSCNASSVDRMVELFKAGNESTLFYNRIRE